LLKQNSFKFLKLSYKLIIRVHISQQAENGSVENQQIAPESPIYKTLLIVFAAVLTLFLAGFSFYQSRYGDPYVKDVLSMPGDVSQGRVIFQMNCAGCHGLYGDGQVGPSLRHVSERKSETGLIHQVTSGKTPPMPQFQPTPQEMADLLKYLESL
jgi:mono/diheme cytochrome c family protein